MKERLYLVVPGAPPRWPDPVLAAIRAETRPRIEAWRRRQRRRESAKAILSWCLLLAYVAAGFYFIGRVHLIPPFEL